MLRRLRGTSIAFALMLAVGPAVAADDWLDDMPSVPTVVEVVRYSVDEQIHRYPQLAADPDFLPMRLIGTFVLLRWVMEFEIETQGPLSAERMNRMRGIANEYMQAEYAIGLGTARRNGLVKNQCQKDGPNRADFKTFASAEACHRYVTQKIISNVYSSFDWRNAVFPLIFCDRAKVYLDLMQKNILTLPAPVRSPAVVGEMPDRSAPVGPRFCDPYGGDANGNGMCEDWERQSATPTTAFRSSGEGCKVIGLTQVRVAQGGGLKVSIDPKTTTPGASVRFRVVRATSAKGDGNAQPIWEGEARMESGVDPAAPLHAIVAQGEKLIPDQDRAFLLVDVVSVRSSGPVHCEQPVPIWAPRHFAPTPSGLHGPYGEGSADAAKRGTDGGVIAPGRGADLAVNATGLLALKLTGTNEAGFLILEDTRAPGRYYATPPVTASPPSNPAANATVTNGDYGSSLRRAFAGSCEETTNFKIAAWVHTHPTQYGGVVWFNDNFSMEDFNFAVDLRRYPEVKFASDLRIGSAFEGSYIVVARDRCIRSFTSQFYDDKDEFTPAEIGQVGSLLGEPDFAHKARQTLWATLTELGMVALSEHYQRFQQRQREVGCY